MTIPIIVVGAGGHAKVVIEALRLLSANILGAVDADPSLFGKSVLGVPVIGGDDQVLAHGAKDVLLVNGVGSIDLPTGRERVFEHFVDAGYRFASVVHPAAVIASEVEVAEGVQVMAGAVVQPGTKLGRNAVVNTRAGVDHDCMIEDHVHIAPGVTLSGGVTVGRGAHIGSGATIIQGVRIGEQSLVAAGAVVVRDVPERTLAKGVPAALFPYPER